MADYKTNTMQRKTILPDDTICSKITDEERAKQCTVVVLGEEHDSDQIFHYDSDGKTLWTVIQWNIAHGVWPHGVYFFEPGSDLDDLNAPFQHIEINQYGVVDNTTLP